MSCINVKKCKPMKRQCIQVRSNSLILFDAVDSASHLRHNLQEETAAVYSGTMTNHARKRLSCAIDILIQRNPTRRIYNPMANAHHDFRLNFITLTVPTSKYITASWGYENLLGKWIRYMRDKYGLREYVWKCELTEQEQPHWHITTNEFIPWPVIRWKWNSLMRNERLLDRYALKHGHFNANSTDIHGVESVVDMQKYLSKEMCKTVFSRAANGLPVRDVRWDKEAKLYKGVMYEDTDPELKAPVEWAANYECLTYPEVGNDLIEARIDGKVWDCSECLKIGRFSAEIDNDTAHMIWDAKRKGKIEEQKTDYCSIIKTMYPLRLLSKDMLEDYRNYIN